MLAFVEIYICHTYIYIYTILGLKTKSRTTRFIIDVILHVGRICRQITIKDIHIQFDINTQLGSRSQILENIKKNAKEYT